MDSVGEPDGILYSGVFSPVVYEIIGSVGGFKTQHVQSFNHLRGFYSFAVKGYGKVTFHTITNCVIPLQIN